LQSTIECTGRRGEGRRGEIMKDVLIEKGVEKVGRRRRRGLITEVNEERGGEKWKDSEGRKR
jgi:hypothetical protein